MFKYKYIWYCQTLWSKMILITLKLLKIKQKLLGKFEKTRKRENLSSVYWWVVSPCTVFQGTITLILATDMARHGEILDSFKQKVDNFDYTDEEHVTCVRTLSLTNKCQFGAVGLGPQKRYIAAFWFSFISCPFDLLEMRRIRVNISYTDRQETHWTVWVMSFCIMLLVCFSSSNVATVGEEAVCHCVELWCPVCSGEK